MVRSLGAVGVARVAVVLRPPLAKVPKLARNSYIDDLVFEKLSRLRMLPSELSTDGEFMRRVYLDVIGTLPRPEEVRRFLAETSPNKRENIVDELFKRIFGRSSTVICSPTVRSFCTTGRLTSSRGSGSPSRKTNPTISLFENWSPPAGEPIRPCQRTSIRFRRSRTIWRPSSAKPSSASAWSARAATTIPVKSGSGTILWAWQPSSRR